MTSVLNKDFNYMTFTIRQAITSLCVNMYIFSGMITKTAQNVNMKTQILSDIELTV